MGQEPSVRTKRIYQAVSADDGARVLVDRLWPRGVSKEQAALDHWLREVAPSDELRRWFDHQPERWVTFQQRYHRELEEPGPARDALGRLRRLVAREPVTLLYAARDTERNNAVALRALLVRDGPM